jgi:hypothetical protein
MGKERIMKSIFKGQIVKEFYYFGAGYDNNSIFGYYSSERKIRIKEDIIEYKTFLEIDLSEPPLQKGDKFYNLNTDKTYYIEDAMRGTGDTMVYFTDKILETIVDEESKQKAEEDKRKYEEEQLKALQEKPQEESKPKPKKSWWKRLFNI